MPPSSEAQHGDITLLFTDIERSTRLWEEHPGLMSVALARHDDLVRRAIESHGGTVFKTVGDAFCAVFSDPVRAIRAAVAAQRWLATEPWPSPVSIRVRMGVHSGICEERGGDFFGPPVNRVARLHSIAHGGQVVASAAAAKRALEQLPDGVTLLDLGDHRLKDLQLPERVFQVCADGLDAEFPPLQSLANPQLRHNLPQQISRFIGRAGELAEVCSTLEESKLVTLVGAGGVGKTRLALQAGAELLDGSGDGVWFIDLAPVSDPDQLAAAAAKVLIVHQDPGEKLAAAINRALRDRRLLLILDNCEHLVDAAASFVHSLLAECRDVAVLATSREPLRVPGERVFRVPSLPVPAKGVAVEEAAGSEAMQLFVDRVKQHEPHFSLDDSNVEHVRSICQRLDGIPLAVELAAAAVGPFNVADLEERLDRRFALLTRGSRSALPRQQTLESLIAWSYELLTPLEQEVFDQLSVFAGVFDVDAAEAVCRHDTADVALVLVDLVDKSLVQAETAAARTGYKLLESMRAYGLERLSRRGGDQMARAQRAHRDYYLAFVEMAEPHLKGPAQLVWLDQIERFEANIGAAMLYCREDPDPDPGLRFVSSLASYWRLRSQLSEAVREMNEHIDRPEAAPPTRSRARALCACCTMLNRSDPHASLVRAEEAVAIARASGDSSLIAEALFWLATSIGDTDRTRAHALTREALALARMNSDDHLVARCLSEQLNFSDPGDPERASLVEEVVRLSGLIGDRRLNLWTTGNLGYIALEAGNLELALEHLRHATALARELGSRNDEALGLINLGFVDYLRGSYGAARDSFQEAATAAHLLGNRMLSAYAVMGMAVTTAQAASKTIASELHGAADALFEEVGHPPEQLEARLRTESHQLLRDSLGPDEFSRHYHTGRNLATIEVIDLVETASRMLEPAS